MPTSQRARRAQLLAARRQMMRRIHGELSCPRCHEESATETHELARGINRASTMAVPELTVPLGPACHKWVTEHPEAAVSAGWAVWGYQLADPLRLIEAQLARLETEVYGRP